MAGETPASSPPPGAGGPPQASTTTPGAKDGLGHALELPRGRGIVRHELFWEAMGALSRLGEELADVYARVVTEDLCLAHEWHQLKVAINLGHLHHERAARCPLKPRARLVPGLWRRPEQPTITVRLSRSMSGNSRPGTLALSDGLKHAGPS